MVIASYNSCKSDSEIFLEDSCFPNFDGKGPKWTENGIFYAFYNLDIYVWYQRQINLLWYTYFLRKLPAAKFLFSKSVISPRLIHSSI